jgi:3-deoxy-D-manno-octulosonate 8-phosphate phosphatase (KDO 8-P phosphatase)
VIAVEAVARVRVLALDCDGVLTGGELIYNRDGDDLHVFNVRDGHGLVLARLAGLKLLLLTGRLSQSVEKRVTELRFDHIVQRAQHKGALLRAWCDAHGFSREEVCFVGDDINDISAARYAGVSVAVADAVPELKAEVGWVTQAAGGRGAVREVCEAILKAQNRWEDIVKRYADEL